MANVRPPLSDIPEEHDVDLDLFSDSFLDGPLKHGSIEDLHNRATKPPPNDHSGRPETPKEQSVLSASVTPQTQAFLNMRDFPQDDIDNEPPKLLTFQQSLPVANVITGFRFDRAPEKKSLYKQSKENQNGAGDKLESALPSRKVDLRQVAIHVPHHDSISNEHHVDPHLDSLIHQGVPPATIQHTTVHARSPHRLGEGFSKQQMHFTHPPLPAIEQHAATVPVNAVVPPVAAMPREKGQHTLPKLQSHKVKVSRIASQKLSGIVPRRRSDERAPAKAMHDHRPLSSAAKPEMPSSSPRPIQHSQAHVAKHAYVEADPADVLDIFSKSKHANRTDNAPFNLEPAKDSTSDALMNTGSRTIIGGEHEGPQPTHSASTSPLSESRQDQPANESYVEPQEDAQQHAHQAIEPSVADVERSTTSQKQPKISTDKFSTDHEASGSLERGQPIGGSSDGRESLSPHPAVPKTKLGRPAQPTRPQRSFPRLQPQSRQPPVLHRPSSRRGPVKVTKSRPATKPNPPPATVRPPAATVPSVGDVFRILQWTMENEQKQSATEAEDRYRAHQSELAELKASEAGKKFRLEALEMEKSSLADQLRLAKSNIRDYEEKVAKLTRFVNGLANDQEKLLEEHKTFRNRCDELILESKTRIEERKQLTEYFQDCLTRSGNIKDLISRAAREAKAELRGVELRSEEFLKQLEEKDDLLQEEKRRIQELQEQLNKAIEAHNNFGELLDEKFNLVSQKLDSMQQEIMTIVVAGTAKPELESLGTQIKELCSKPISSPTELEKVEGALQQLSESMTAHFETLAAKGSETTAAKEVVELQLKRQVSEIKNDILTCHALQTELTELRSSKAALEERCTLKDASVTSLEEQVAELREKENTSFEKLSQAELEVKRLKLATENNQHTTARLRELELQVADTNERLITAKEELRTEKEKVATLEESEATLKERVEDLEQQPANDPKEQVDIESIKAEAQRLAEEQINERCAQITSDADRFRREQVAESDNKVHLEKQRSSRAEASLKQKERELSDTRKMLDETRQSSATAQVSQSEISALQDRVQALMSSVEEKKNELKQLQADNKKAWEEQLRQNRAEVAEKENQLKTEIALRKIAQSNFDRLTKQTDSHIKDQQEKSNRQIESLHEQVAEAESEKTEAQNKVQKAMKDSEQAIKTTKDKHKAELGDLHRRLQDIESSRQQVVQQLKDAEKAAGKELHLRSEESKRLIELEQQRRIVVQQDLERLQNSIAGLSKGRSASADTTQTIKASQSQNTDSQFKRPRKKVDRQSQSVIQVPGTSSGHQRRTSQENHRGDEYSQGQYQAVFETFIDTGDDNAENHRFAPKPVPFSQFDNHGAVAERLDDGSGSPLSEPRSESDASKENVRIATPGALRGVREDSSILRELTVNATTPVRTEETPVRAPPQRDSSSLGRTDVLENPFEIYNSPNGEIEMPSLFRPQSNTASRRMAHDVPRQARDVPTTALSQSHHEGPQDMDTSFLKRQEPMRRSLIAEQPADFRREPAKGSDHSSTPDYVQGEPLQSQRVTTYGHRSSSRPNSGNSRRASSIVRATPAAEQHAFQTLQRSRSKQLKRPATPGTVPVNFTPRIKRLRTREERNYAEVSSQSDAQSGVTTQTMSRGPSVKASQSQSQAIKKSESQSQSVFKQSESQSQRANPNDVPLSTRARVGSSGGLKRATGRGGSSKGRKVNERYSTRFSQI